MSRLELQRLVTRDFGYADTPASAVSTRIQGYLNDRHQRILSAPGRDSLRREVLTLPLIVSQAVYPLETDIARVLHVVDTTNDHVLEERSLDWYRRVEPDPTNGTQEVWIPMRLGPALRDIHATGSGIWVNSTSASDAMTAHVETLNSTGGATSTTATVNGTTRVQIGTATTHRRLVRFAISTVAVGDLELYDAAAAGNLISRIPLGRTTAQNFAIAFWPTPGATDTVRLDVIHYIRDFSLDYQEPQLPYTFHYLLALGARIDEARHRAGGNAPVDQWEVELAKGLRDLDTWITNSPELIVIPGDIGEQGRSNLGGFFPSGIW